MSYDPIALRTRTPAVVALSPRGRRILAMKRSRAKASRLGAINEFWALTVRINRCARSAGDGEIQR